MKKTKVKKETEEFSAAVGRALRRAAKVARKTARMHGTPILYLGERQSRCREAVNDIAVHLFAENSAASSLSHGFEDVHKPQMVSGSTIERLRSRKC